MASDPHDWFSADTLLHHKTSRQPLAQRKIGNNTYLRRIHGTGSEHGDIAVRLHNTDVVLYHADGTLTLNAGGWYTVTTKDRINRYCGEFTIASDRGQWKIYIHNPNPQHRYSDTSEEYWAWLSKKRQHPVLYQPFTLPAILADLRGETVDRWVIKGIDGTFPTKNKALAARRELLGPKPEHRDDTWLTVGDFYDGVLLDPANPTKYWPSAELARAERHDEKVIQQVDRYMRGLSPKHWAEIVADAKTNGQRGDCLICQMGQEYGHDHLQSHLDERYYMVSLAWNAIDASGYRPEVYISDLKMVKRQLRKYFLSRLLQGNRQGRVGYKHDYGQKGWR